MLSALNSRVGQGTPMAAQQRNFAQFTKVNSHGQRQGVNVWNNMFLFKTLFVLMTSGFIEGFDLGIITFANLYVKDRFFLSLGSLGAAIGALISGPIVDKFGRKPIVLFADGMYLLGGIIMSFYNLSYGSIYCGRLFIGVAIGVTSMNVPVYISEIVPNEFRGRFVAWYTFITVFGVMTANVVSLILNDHFLAILWIAEVFVIV